MRNDLKKLAHILQKYMKYLLTIKEAENIQITHLNAAKGGFGKFIMAFIIITNNIFKGIN